MNSEIIRKLALQQIKEEETKKKEDELQKAVLAEVERLRSRPTTEVVKDDMSDLRNELRELKRKVSSLEEKLLNNPLERKVLQLATYMGDSTLKFRSGNGMTTRTFRGSYEILQHTHSNNNWNDTMIVGGLNLYFMFDYSRRIFQLNEQENNYHPSGGNTFVRSFEYTFKECCIDPYSFSKNEILLDVTSDKVTVRVGDLLVSRSLGRTYTSDEMFEPGFITPYSFREYY
jgi:hypothetical protein